MNLARHTAVLWRYRVVTIAGVALSVLFAVLASYKVSPSGIEARGESVWSSDSALLVTQPGFPEGRVAFPEAPEAKTDASGEIAELPKDQLLFADPNRFGALADLYSQLAMSDRVRKVAPEKPKPLQVTASALQGASGGVILPVIKMTTDAPTKEGAKVLNDHMIEALKKTITEDQVRNQIPDKQRVELQVLNTPSAGYLKAGPSKTGSMIALVLGLLATVALTHLLAMMRARRTGGQAIEGIIDPWTEEERQSAAPAPRQPVTASVWGAPPAPHVPSTPPAPPAPGRTDGRNGRR